MPSLLTLCRDQLCEERSKARMGCYDLKASSLLLASSKISLLISHNLDLT